MYKRQQLARRADDHARLVQHAGQTGELLHGKRLAAAIDLDAGLIEQVGQLGTCLLYTSDAADERSSVDLGGRRIIKKKKKLNAETQAAK